MATIEEHIEAAVLRYSWTGPVATEKAAAHGMNNTTRIVSCGEQKHVLRLYNNHEDTNTVRLEHAMLKALSPFPFDFRVPEPIANLDGDTVTILPDGKLACLFRYIDGERPTPENADHVKALGAAAGQLSRALNAVNLAATPQYSPYYELGSTYAAMDKTAFLAIAKGDALLRAQAQQFDYLQNERETALQACGRVSELPRQWIHGDICCGNAVSIGNRISGILDFEFVTVDTRAMELAVLMVDLLKREFAANASERMELAAQAFQASVKLSAEERKLLPTLMKLRLLDIALHFAVRYREGLDGPDVLAGIVDSCSYGCEWITQNKPVY